MDNIIEALLKLLNDENKIRSWGIKSIIYWKPEDMAQANLPMIYIEPIQSLNDEATPIHRLQIGIVKNAKDSFGKYEDKVGIKKEVVQLVEWKNWEIWIKQILKNIICLIYDWKKVSSGPVEDSITEYQNVNLEWFYSYQATINIGFYW